MRERNWMSEPARRWALALAVLFVASFAVRAFVAAALDHPPTFLHDAGWYDFFGKQIASGRGYSLTLGEPTAAWPPGYPYFLGGIYRLTGDSQLAARVVQAVVGAATVVVTAELGRRLANPATGFAAGLILAFMPSHVLFTALLMSEVLFTLLLTAGVLLALKPASFRRAAAAGLVFGLAMLVRPQAAIILAAIFGWWIAIGYLTEPRRIRSIAAGGVIAGAMALTIVPWSVRNHAQMGTWSTSTNTGLNLWIGNNPDADGGFRLTNTQTFDLAVATLERPESEVLHDRLAREAAVEYIKRNPVDTLLLAPEKIRRTYENDRAFTPIYNRDGDNLRTISGRQLDLLSDAYYYPVLLAALCGTVLLAWTRRSTAGLIALVLVAWSLVSIVFFGQNRFHIPVLPILVIPAGYAVAEAIRALAPGRLGTAPERRSGADAS